MRFVAAGHVESNRIHDFTMEIPMEMTKFSVPSISCGHCAATITRELNDLEGVKIVDVDPAAKLVTVHWRAPARRESIVKLLNEIGFPPVETA